MPTVPKNALTRSSGRFFILNLNPFFSKDEKHRLRKRIKELRQNPGNKKLAEMIGYITYMEDMAMYVFLAGIVSN